MKKGVSIIVSCRDKTGFVLFEDNVAKTIGCDYEIIQIFNPGKYSLCAAYNIGIKRVRYEYVCFVHDDVEFLVDDWGKHCISVFESVKGCGLIGVAGSAYKTWLAGSWFSTFTWDYCRGHIRQSNKERTFFREDDFDRREEKQTLSEVVCVDGVFMFTSFVIANNLLFDENRFDGYHCYDLDFSTGIFLQGYKVIVDRDMYLCHYSPGLFSHDFAEYAWKYTRKFRRRLPLHVGKIPFDKILYIELRTWHSLIKRQVKKMLGR